MTTQVGTRKCSLKFLSNDIENCIFNLRYNVGDILLYCKSLRLAGSAALTQHGRGRYDGGSKWVTHQRDFSKRTFFETFLIISLSYMFSVFKGFNIYCEILLITIQIF